jgi:endonuclease YncB( thermonuclease family)
VIEVAGYPFALLLAVCIFVSFIRHRIPRKLKVKANIVDGGGLMVQGHNIRLHGMDAPEIDQSYGRLAKPHLWTLAGGKTVTCKPIARDHHGRLVAKCSAG